MCLLLLGLPACASLEPRCSNDWQITGYYTPVEASYDGDLATIVVDDQQISFASDFLRAVKMEGWGKTDQGWYLGYYSKTWHKSAEPLNRHGKSLQLGMAAVDPTVVAMGTRFYVPSLGHHLGQQVFVAADVGGRIQRKHIDIYTGEGEQAQRATYAVTGTHQLCYAP